MGFCSQVDPVSEDRKQILKTGRATQQGSGTEPEPAAVPLVAVTSLPAGVVSDVRPLQDHRTRGLTGPRRTEAAEPPSGSHRKWIFNPTWTFRCQINQPWHKLTKRRGANLKGNPALIDGAAGPRRLLSSVPSSVDYFRLKCNSCFNLPVWRLQSGTLR